MRKKGSTFFPVFFQIFKNKKLEHHWKQKNSSNKIRILPAFTLIMVGLLIMTKFSLPLVVSIETEDLYPLSSELTLKDSILENQTLFYQTFYQQVMSDGSCEEGESNVHYSYVNLSQDIVYDSNNNMLNIFEEFGEQSHNYNITSTSDVPVVFNYLYPFDIDGWQHNYPKENSTIVLNNQEITYLVYDRFYKIVSTYQFDKNMDLEYGDLVIPTQLFTTSKTFEVELGFG